MRPMPESRPLSVTPPASRGLRPDKIQFEMDPQNAVRIIQTLNEDHGG